MYSTVLQFFLYFFHPTFSPKEKVTLDNRGVGNVPCSNPVLTGHLSVSGQLGAACSLLSSYTGSNSAFWRANQSEVDNLWGGVFFLSACFSFNYSIKAHFTALPWLLMFLSQASVPHREMQWLTCDKEMLRLLPCLTLGGFHVQRWTFPCI